MITSGRHPRPLAERAVAALPFLALVRRELVRTLRRVRVFVFLVALVLVSIYLAIDNWPPPTITGFEMGWRAQGVLSVLAVALYIGVVLLMPAYGATCMVVEREQNTYDLLALSLIRPAGILAGKLLNTLGLFALLCVAMLPLTASLFFLVGIDWNAFLCLVGIIGVTAFWCAAAGLYCSVRMRGTVSAVLASYVIVSVLLGLYLIPIVFVMEMLGIRSQGPMLERVGIVLSSPVALACALDAGLSLTVYSLTLCVQSGYAVLALALAWLWLRRPREAPVMGDPRPSLISRVLGRAPVRVTEAHVGYNLIPDVVNPVGAKETRWGALSSPRSRRRLFLGASAFMCVLEFSCWALAMRNNPPPPEQVQMMGSCAWILMAMIFTCIVAPALLANTLTKEYERENTDALRMTLLRPRQIVWGKARGGVARALPLFLACAPSGVLLPILVGHEYWIWEFVICGLVSVAVCFCVAMSLSMCANLMTRRTPTAIILSYAFSWMVLFGFYFIAGIGNMEFRNGKSTDVYYSAAAFFSPLVAYFDNLNQLGFIRYTDVFREQGGSVITAYWKANVVFHILFSGFLLAVCSRVFARNRMQDR